MIKRYFTQGGKIGIVISNGWLEPLKETSQDEYAAERALQFMLGYIISPLLGTGDYPEIMKSTIQSVSKIQGYPQSRLPTVNDA